MNNQRLPLDRDNLRIVDFGWNPDHVVATMRVTDAEVLRMLLTDLCSECEGSGDPNPPCDDPECAMDHAGSCPSCGGRGWLPKDGTGLMLLPGKVQDVETPLLVVPLSMLEVDDDE